MFSAGFLALLLISYYVRESSQHFISALSVTCGTRVAESATCNGSARTPKAQSSYAASEEERMFSAGFLALLLISYYLRESPEHFTSGLSVACGILVDESATKESSRKAKGKPKESHRKAKGKP